jgi:Polyketide cyclase / dehydrase and lipid transport
MPTKSLGHAETRSISIAAPPATVLDLLGDARRLPDWAPAFASSVKPDGPDWLIDSGGTQFRIRLQFSPEHGIVDLARPGDLGGGARMRVLHNEDGSELVFTLIFPAGTAADVIA